MNLFHKLILKRRGLSDDDIALAEKLGFDWSEVLALLIQFGLPALIAFLQSLLPKE